MNPLSSLKAGLAATAFFAVVIAGTYVYHTIYQRGYDAATAVAKADQQLMTDANNKAIAQAEKGMREDIATMQQNNERLEDALAANDIAAAADPDADKCGVRSGGVHRLNAIR